ncbi:MAG TPA: M14 family metallopeptidase [Vicinamibacteria bacterium]|nr:M14 family metallopeptidase [Vicinamibacteria bacterium]
MRRPFGRLALAVVVVLPAVPVSAAIPTPSEFLKMPIGADRTVADYRQVVSYFKALDAASDRVVLQDLGKTTLGEDMVMAVISSEANIRNLPRLKEIAKKVADPRGLSDAETEALTKEGRLMLLVTCNIHSTEIGASQMAMEWAHALATAQDEVTRKRLDEVVLLLLPSINPDGQIMETEWYRKNLGTPHEGGRMPWLYHHYVGHDNNRDWFMLTQKETKAVSRAVYHEWFPQIWLDEHQMGSTGPRIFVPPYSDPVDVDIHPLVWREVNLIGANMALRLEEAGKKGVIYGYSYDAYWPGGTKNTAWWKNVSGLLTEVASVRFATPMRIEPGELSGGRKGLVEYAPTINFPNPWPGGWWRLRDIIDYERIASDALLESCAMYRRDFLRNAVTRARAAIAAFGPGDAWRIPAEQRDRAGAQRLAALMVEHGVEVRSAVNGDAWIPLAQPYGRFVEEMFTVQRYPEVKLVAGKDIVRPYDVSAWSLPLMMGVTVERTTLPADGLGPFTPAAARVPTEGAAFAVAPSGPEEARAVAAAVRAAGGKVWLARDAVTVGDRRFPAGTVFLDGSAARAAAAKAVPGLSWTAVPAVPSSGVDALRAPRVGLYKPWAASMDEGWTRFTLEQYGFDPKTLDNKAIRAGRLGLSYDVIVLPDVSKEVIATGRPRRDEEAMRYFIDLPAEYAGGLDKEGAAALKEFVKGGGTLVALSGSAEYVIDELALPVRNVLSRARGEDFSATGSLLRVNVGADHPVTYGLPSSVAVFQDKPLAFETAIPGAEMERWILATYPEDDRDILVSGYIHGADRLSRRAAAVAVTYGKGKVVLLGFRPQHRAQTPATFPFLFNALWWSVLK